MNVSVVVPAYNAEKTIANCINSLLKQTRKPGEIIVVDDASSDRTADIVAEFSKRNRIVKLIRLKENSGPAKARNIGMGKARASIVIFVDSDCVAAKNFVEEIVKPIEKWNAIAVQGAYKTKQKNLIAKFSQIEIEYRYTKMLTEQLKKGSIDFVGSYAVAFKKEILKKKKFDERFKEASGEDMDFSFAIHKLGKLVFNPKAIVYHKHPKSIAEYLRKKLGRAVWRVVVYEKHPRKILKESYTPLILKIRIGIAAILYITLALWLASIIDAKPFIAAAILFAVSCIPFVMFALRYDLRVAVLSPALLFLRESVFLLGLVKGTIRRLLC